MESTLSYQTNLKLLEYEEFWISQCKQFEKMELSKDKAEELRLKNLASIPEFFLLNGITEFEEVEIQEKLDKIKADVDIAITKGEIIYRNNETDRISKTYNGFAPLVYFFLNTF